MVFTPMEDIFIARQPIYKRNLDIVGYELLYRNMDQNCASVTDGELASSQVIVNTFINIGLENIVGSNFAFINLTRKFIVAEHLLPMSPEQVVLEVLEDIYPDKDVISGLSRLADQNYIIALDDFVYHPQLDPLLKIANLVKIDLFKGKDDLKRQVNLLKKYDLKLLAEKVESEEDFNLCKDLGFDYFQGYFFSRPNVINHKDIPSNKVVIFELINKLQDPSVSMEELENIIIKDVALTYKLLRYINCAAYAIRKEVESIKQALILLGTQTVKNWVTLIIMSNLNNNKSSELITTAIVRAKMCELLSEIYSIGNKHQLFTVGLFSILDVLMDIPMSDLLDTLSLNSSMKFALLKQEGELGQILKQVLLYEQGEWSKLEMKNIDASAISGAYLEAVKWADTSTKLLK